MAGDPFLYDCGPEEAQACVKAGVGFEIVPGISSALAVPAYAGIPLTTRTTARSTVLSCADKVDWAGYAHDRTLVVLSAEAPSPRSPSALVAAGCAQSTPRWR